MRSVSGRAETWALLFALVFPTLLTLVYFVLLADCATWMAWTAYGVGKIIQFSLPLVWVLALEGRGLGWRRPGTKGLAEGIGFGAFVLAAMLLMYALWLEPDRLLADAGLEVSQKLTRLGVDSPAKYVTLGVFYSLVHSLLEEYYWRWFVFGRLRRLIPLWPAIVVSSLGFMGHHVLVLSKYFGWFSPATVLFSLAVAAGGAVWAWIYHRSDSLWGPWLSHLLADAGIFLVGYHLAGGLLAW